jgi:CheY-like chemotaxis protein
LFFVRRYMPFLDNLHPVTIVIVEDHSGTRTLLTQFLEQRGAHVVAVSNAAEGLQAVLEHNPRVVLSDLGLPDRSGFDLLKNIRALNSETQKTPVIAMTAIGKIVERERAIAAGFHDFLRKPFGPDALLRALESVLR